MAMNFLHHHPFSSTLFKLSSFPLFLCLFLSLFSYTTSPSPPPTPALSAAESLRSKGYTLFAAAIDAAIAADSAFFSAWNGTGTLFAPPDFTFSFTTPRFKKGRASPRRPSHSLLSFHTLRKPIRFADLTSSPEDQPFLTFSPRKCIFKCRNPTGELCIAGRKKHSGEYVRIRHPDLFVHADFVVHGIDGVLDPISASKCTTEEAFDPTAMASSPPIKSIDSSYLDHAVRALRRRGFGVVATAIAMRRSDLMSLTGVTVFAPTDDGLFALSNGFHYDFRYHVVPRRLRFQDLAKLPEGAELETLVSNESLAVRFVNGDVIVNGVMIDNLEIYRNEWIVILAISQPLQSNGVAPANSQDFGESPVVISVEMSDSEARERSTLSPSAKDPEFHADSDLQETRINHSEAPMINDPDSQGTFSENDEEMNAEIVVQSPAPASASVPDDVRCVPSASQDNGNGPVSALSVGLESYCPLSPRGSVSEAVAPLSSTKAQAHEVESQSPSFSGPSPFDFSFGVSFSN